jgi:hypothetical protein
MKKFALILTILCAFCALADAGPERYSGNDKEIIQPAPPPCAWYRAHEWDLNLWGTYAFPANTGDRSISFRSGPIENGPDPDIPGTNEQFDNGRVSADRFINRDGAWGAGADVKYFFTEHWALGVEGFVLDCADNTGGAGLGTVTFRYPIGCSRFAPYAFAGFGVLNGGSHTNRFFAEHIDLSGFEFEGFENRSVQEKHTRAIGQFGAGLEVRITRHIGVMGDFAWNVVQDGDNNFGMARFGVTLAY